MYIALFLSRPELYADVLNVALPYKQETFFRKFKIFVEQYYKFNFEKETELFNYFDALYIHKAGEVNVTGGGSGGSRSGRKQSLQTFNQGQDHVRKYIKVFQDKYNVSITNEQDNRMYIGHTMPWLNPSPQLLEKENWGWVVNQCYDDITMTKALPDVVNPALIPLKIRNVVYQKWMKQNKPVYVNDRLKTINIDADEEELAYLAKTTGQVQEDKTPIKKVEIDEALLEDW
jgi:hypothetical protein